MNNIYLLYKFNSYHDRILKRFDTLSDYISSPQVYDLVANANFDYKDGVTASVTYNIGTVLRGDDDTPNYCLVVDSNSNICSRWYIVDGNKTRKGQYVLTLLRDGIADYFNEIKSAPIYLEKGSLKLTDTPFIFNSEDIDFNQIKTSETLLKDKTDCPWIIGFMANKQPEGTSDAFNTTVNTAITGQVDATYGSMANYPYWNYFGLPPTGGYKYLDSNKGRISIWFKINNSSNLIINYKYANGSLSYESGDYDFSGDGITNYTNCRYQLGGSWLTYATNNTAYGINGIASTIMSELNTNAEEFLIALRTHTLQYGDVHTNAQGQQCKAENGKIIKTNNSATNPNDGITYAADTYSIDIHDNTYFDLYGNRDNNAVCTGNVPVGSNLNNYVVEVLDDVAQYSGGNLTVNGSYMNMTMWAQGGRVCTFELQSTTVATISFSLNANARPLIDAPYRMFAMPYNENVVKWKKGSTYYVSNKNYNMSVAQGIATTFSGTWLYDLQLVPYCPFIKSDIITNANNETTIDISSLAENTDYQIIGNDTAVIIWCQTSQVSNYVINHIIPAAESAVERKVKNQCDLYRLSSPSYNSIFEFNAEKNGGVNYFDVDFVYKPYDSYIHMNPNFGMLYGSDFNDARGLVFTGPFSLPQTTSAWQQYKLNNMNYQNSFDRQIENMDVMHKYDMIELGIKGITGTVQGGVNGAATGAMLGGPGGAIAGGILGAGASLGGSVADQMLATAKYKETVDYTRDQFNMSLQNVKAQAQALSKVSAFTPNNKVFPVLEYYTCTDTEKNAFRLKLKYNGMKINAIMSIDSLYTTFPQSIEDKRYTKGKLIRLNINDDNHLVEHISEELNKGVFI